MLNVSANCCVLPRRHAIRPLQYAGLAVHCNGLLTCRSIPAFAARRARMHTPDYSGFGGKLRYVRNAFINLAKRIKQAIVQSPPVNWLLCKLGVFSSRGA